MADVALITGANRGLGLALAGAALERGLDVIATARRPDAADDLRALDPGGGRLAIVQLDVASEADRAHLAGLVDRPLSLVIHNAGINSMSPGVGETAEHFRLGSLTEEALALAARTNAIGPLLLTQRLIPHLARGARVVAISSWLGSIAGSEGGGNYAYAGSKALLNMYVRLAGNALVERGVTCFAVNPGWVRTDMGGPRAVAEPGDVATAIVALALAAGPDAAGRFLDVDGTDHAW